MLGVGLAAAVLIDATVVRGVILPAALALLGERAWYLPPWLAWRPGRPAHPLMHPAPGLASQPAGGPAAGLSRPLVTGRPAPAPATPAP
jgi:RND superfamily putative drug exporter